MQRGESEYFLNQASMEGGLILQKMPSALEQLECYSADAPSIRRNPRDTPSHRQVISIMMTISQATRELKEHGEQVSKRISRALELRAGKPLILITEKSP
jgi:hypothetical protein